MDPTGSSYEDHRRRFERFFDRERKRLVYVGVPADSDFWDRRWLGDGRSWYPARPPSRSLVVRETRRALPAGSTILEGGCGMAADSWNLHRLGYKTLALDYALRTLHVVRAQVPEVRPFAGDVHRLPIADGTVDGYWSLGVIEHFYDGYEPIRDEAWRVIRPGGFLFLTFPALSPLRRAKARLGMYRRWRPTDPGRRDGFYQFGLDERQVLRDFAQRGFRLERAVPYLGVSGLFEELGAFGRAVDRGLRRPQRPVRFARAVLDRAVRPLTFHVRLLVLKRT